MSAGPPPDRATRYAAWLDRWRNAVFAVSVAIVALGGGLASRLELRSDLSSLLPPSTRSVQDLEVLRHRARSFGNVLVMLDAPSPQVRAAAATELEAGLRALDPALVGTVATDDNAAARYAWDPRFLFVELEDLRVARAALADRLREARLDANPLYIDLDDDDDAAAEVEASRLDELAARLDDAERAATAPTSQLSEDGKSQLITLQVTFPASDIGKGRTVMRLVGSVLAVGLVLGWRRDGAITLICGAAGIVVMIAACALAGLRVHFLDLIALPITIGIGIDYAVNLVARDRAEPGIAPRRLFETTGAAALLVRWRARAAG